MPVRPLLSIALLLAFPSLAIAQSGSNLPSPEAAQEQDLLEQSRTQVRGFSVWLGELNLFSELLNGVTNNWL